MQITSLTYFDDKAATVACLQLGLKGPGKAVKGATDFFDEGKGPTWLSEIICTGTEPGIEYCVHDDWGSSIYGHALDVGVVCNGAPLPT